MLVTAGTVLEVGGGDAVSVVDTIVWPAAPAYLFSARAAGDVPVFADAVVGAEMLMSFLKKFAANHGLQEEFHAAAIEAAALVGSTWLMAVDEPLAAAAVPYAAA